MIENKPWQVEIQIGEHDGWARAEARLHDPDQARPTGVGFARLNPAGLQAPEIGHELALAHALSDLGHKLLEAAARDIEQLIRQPHI